MRDRRARQQAALSRRCRYDRGSGLPRSIAKRRRSRCVDLDGPLGPRVKRPPFHAYSTQAESFGGGGSKSVWRSPRRRRLGRQRSLRAASPVPRYGPPAGTPGREVHRSRVRTRPRSGGLRGVYAFAVRSLRPPPWTGQLLGFMRLPTTRHAWGRHMFNARNEGVRGSSPRVGLRFPGGFRGWQLPVRAWSTASTGSGSRPSRSRHHGARARPRRAGDPRRGTRFPWLRRSPESL